MEFFFLAILIGLIPAAVAHAKGRSFPAWWIYGTLLFIIALPHSLLMSPDRLELERQQLDAGMKKCPDCAELIKAEARICRFCGAAVEPVRDLPCHYCGHFNEAAVETCEHCGQQVTGPAFIERSFSRAKAKN